MDADSHADADDDADDDDADDADADAPHLWIWAQLLPLELNKASEGAVVQLRVNQLGHLVMIMMIMMLANHNDSWSLSSLISRLCTWFEPGSDREGPRTLVSTVETTWICRFDHNDHLFVLIIIIIIVVIIIKQPEIAILIIMISVMISIVILAW